MSYLRFRSHFGGGCSQRYSFGRSPGLTVENLFGSRSHNVKPYDTPRVKSASVASHHINKLRIPAYWFSISNVKPYDTQRVKSASVTSHHIQ